MPLNWTFPYVIHEGSINRKSKPQFSFSSLARIDQGAPYAPTLRPLTESTFDTQIAEKPNATDRTIVVTKTTQPSLRDNGPPIVVITPPGSPRDRSYAYDEFELSNKSSVSPDRSPEHRRRKVLVVSNPDSDSDSDKPSNYSSQRNYAPPPLPEISSLSLSSRLAPSRPSHRRCLTEDSSWRPNNRPTNASPSPSLLHVSPPASGHRSSTANSGLSLFGRHNRPRVDTSIDKGVSDYTDNSDTDDDLHLWNKPPTALHGESSHRKLTCASSPTLGRGEEEASRKSRRVSRGNTKAPGSGSRQSWLTRPGLDDVYDHLQRFFPDHEVGQTFTQPRANGSISANGIENKELVRPDAQTTASVQVQRNKRQLPGKPQSKLCKMTRFWSTTEER